MKSDTPTSCRCRSVRQCLHAPHDKWRGHQTGVMSRPGPVEMRTRSDIPVLLTAPAIDLRASPQTLPGTGALPTHASPKPANMSGFLSFLPVSGKGDRNSLVISNKHGVRSGVRRYWSG